MGPWVFAVVGACAVAVLSACVLALRAARGSSAELRAELVTARGDVDALTTRIEDLAAEVELTRQAAADQARRAEVVSFDGDHRSPFVITGLPEFPQLPTPPREAQLVHALEVSRPVWVPAKPLHEVLVRTVAWSYGVRSALAPDQRDRIRLEMRAEVRRSRRQRQAEIKAVRRYLRQRRKTAA